MVHKLIPDLMSSNFGNDVKINTRYGDDKNKTEETNKCSVPSSTVAQQPVPPPELTIALGSYDCQTTFIGND